MKRAKTEIKGLLIDMDGTLVDHIETITRCFQYATNQLGFPEPSPETVLRSIGGSMPVTIQKFLPPEKVEEGKALWRQRFDEIHLEGVRLLPGARELLEFCKGKKLAVGVFTNKTGRHTRAIVKQEGLDHLIAFSLGAEDTSFRKPNPEFSDIAIERLGLEPSNVAMVGDSPFDIQAGKAVGMITLCVTTGSHSRSELRSEGADLIFDSLLDLKVWLEN